MYEYNVERNALAELLRVARGLQRKRYRDAQKHPHQGHHEAFCKEADRAVEIAEKLYNASLPGRLDPFGYPAGNGEYYMSNTKPTSVKSN